MTDGVFKPVPWTVNGLVQAVSSGTLALPDLQRPFVWDNPKVRDLIDSMYRGYPVGELMFWHRGPGDDVTTIGTDGKSQAVTHQIVDGQQRLTSLYAVFTGREVVDDRYRTKNIRISFNPFIERFEVARAITDGSADWVPNIHSVFNAPLEAHQAFCARYEDKHPDQLDEAAGKALFATFNKLSQLGGYQFTVVELQQAVDKPKVADIFVRINSEGVSLKSADFILTWLSVFWPEGREELEGFSRGSRITAERASELAGHKVAWTPINHHLHINPGQLVRVAVAVGQNRGRLQDAYSALRGRDRRTGLSDPHRQEVELDKFKSAVPLMLKHLNWDEFLRVMTKAGFRSRKMITSNNTVIYTYALWLIGREGFGVEQTPLRDLMARWFFMSQTTGRYTNSPETRIQQDLDRLDGVVNAEGFISVLEGVIGTVLTGDYWEIRMPDDLVSSSLSASPVYQAYLAALNVLDADLFMLHGKIRDWMDPTGTTVKDVEGHHLFPKSYLHKHLGLADVKKTNQIANFAPTDWATNILISDKAPSDYWPALVKSRGFSGESLSRQMFWHALPEGWDEMDYEDFLNARRHLMANVTREGFKRLSDPTYQPDVSLGRPSDAATQPPAVTLTELVSAGILPPGSILSPVDLDFDLLAEVTADGQLDIDGELFDDLTRAASAVGSEIEDGEEFWCLAEDEQRTPVASLVGAGGATGGTH